MGIASLQVIMRTSLGPETQSSLRKALRVIVLGGLLAASAIFTSRVADAEDTKPSISLVDQSLANGPGEAFRLRLDISATSPPEPLRVVLTLHDQVRSRTRFARSLDGASSSALRALSFPVPPTELIAADRSPFTLDVPMISPGEPDRPDAFPPVGPGVYPLTVSLRAGAQDEEVHHFGTFLIRKPDTDAAPPLRVALVLPFGSGPSLKPAGSIDLGRRTKTHLEAIARVLTQVPDTPLSITPTPETLDALSASNSPALAALSGGLEGRQLVGDTYVGIDLTSMNEPEGLDRLLAQRAAGLSTLDHRLQRRGGARTWVEKGSLDTTGIGQLADLGIDHLVVQEQSMVGLSAPLTLAKPFRLQDPLGRSVMTASVNEALGAHLTDAEDPVLGAFHLMADLAVVYFESPGMLRGVVVRPTDINSVDPESLRRVLGLLNSNPLLVQPVTLDDFFEQVAPATTKAGDPLLRRLSRTSAPPGVKAIGPFDKLHADVKSVETLVSANDSTMDLARRLLLVSEASGLSDSDRQQYRTAAQEQIGSITERIRVIDRGTYRLTDQEGTVPITLTNTQPNSPAKVQLQLQSDKLEFLDGDAKRPGIFRKNLTLTKPNTTLKVRVRYRTPGAFPMEIKITTPDGNLALMTGRFEVRSTVISGVGVLLSLGAGLFLLFWWARHWRSARRANRLIAVSSGLAKHP